VGITRSVRYQTCFQVSFRVENWWALGLIYLVRYWQIESYSFVNQSLKIGSLESFHKVEPQVGQKSLPKSNSQAMV
jgi:hypothetical protein